jgi:hypothetical protein
MYRLMTTALCRAATAYLMYECSACAGERYLAQESQVHSIGAVNAIDGSSAAPELVDAGFDAYPFSTADRCRRNCKQLNSQCRKAYLTKVHAEYARGLDACWGEEGPCQCSDGGEPECVACAGAAGVRAWELTMPESEACGASLEACWNKCSRATEAGADR